jgi:NADP-dependent 3-hydroxy acid dehydrogenase YdfG
VPSDQATIAISGAGSGLGEAMAYRFARAGYRVAVTDCDAGRAEQVLANIREAGGSGFAQVLDVTSGEQWKDLHQKITKDWGRLDVLVNNAGVAGAGRLEDFGMDDWEWLMDINLMGVVRGCHHFVPMMREQGHGHVVNVASFAGMIPVPELSAYATAKAAVVALSEQLRVDLANSGVGISVLCPAYVQTALLDSFRSRNRNHKKTAEKWMAGSRISADDVAETVHKGVLNKKFLLLTHGETRWIWRFRRWFPQLFYRSILRAERRLSSKYASLNAEP